MKKIMVLVIVTSIFFSFFTMTDFAVNAASENMINRVIVVSKGHKFLDPRSAPKLRIEEKYSDEFADQRQSFRLILGNAIWLNDLDFDTASFKNLMGEDGNDIFITKQNDSTVTATVYGNKRDASRLFYEFPMLVEVIEKGEATVTIDPRDSYITGGTYIFAVSNTPEIVASINTIDSFSHSVELGDIILDETSTSQSNYNLSLNLPLGFEWQDSGTLRSTMGFSDATSAISTDKRFLKVRLEKNSIGARGSVIIERAKIRATSDAVQGPVEMSILLDDKATYSLPIAFFADPDYIVSIAAGANHTVALKANGIVLVWGDNTYGQCNVPDNLQDVVSIAAGANHTVALKSDGTVIAWGDNRKGQSDIP